MNKIIVLIAILSIFSCTAVSFAAAPNSGDCVSDGSGWEQVPGPASGRGPAPHSGDGISDGSGF